MDAYIIRLGILLIEQRSSLRTHICEAAVIALSPELKLNVFCAENPSQVGILGLQFLWTRDVEHALVQALTHKKVMQSTDDNFLAMLTALIENTSTQLTKVERTKFESLVTLHCHQYDVFHNMVLLNVCSLNDFEWYKQSRYYFELANRKINITITDISFNYCDEFIGCVERLCVTPLTDRCYITLVQALGMGFGGAIVGPAGTG